MIAASNTAASHGASKSKPKIALLRRLKSTSQVASKQVARSATEFADNSRAGRPANNRRYDT